MRNYFSGRAWGFSLLFGKLEIDTALGFEPAAELTPLRASSVIRCHYTSLTVACSSASTSSEG